MNCRRVSNLLSAYMDQELAGAEMLDIRAHLDRCSACAAEYESLRETKRLLSRLALRIPPAELEAALLSEVERHSHPLRRWMPWMPWMPSWIIAWQQGAISPPPVLRPRSLATAALSLAGLFLATARLETPRLEDGSARATTVVPAPRLDAFAYSSGYLYPVSATPEAAGRSFSPPLLADPNPLQLSRFERPRRFGNDPWETHHSAVAPRYILTTYPASSPLR